jgi:hypothetical protein
MSDRVGLPNLTYAQIQQHFEKSAGYIHRHTVTMCRKDTTICSGVYVKTSGYHGILTAGHCAKLVLDEERLNLAVSEQTHHCWVERNVFAHVPFDEIRRDGPDMSFLIIQDKDLIDLIQRQNFNFYDLDNQNVDILRGDLVRFSWFVVGSPREKLIRNDVLINDLPHRFISMEAAGMQGNLVEFTSDGKYDYVWLDLLCDTERFPKSYVGVSGGGIWYLHFVTKDHINYTIEPILAGITAWQVPVQNEPNRMMIKGHAYNSIYGRVRQVLAEKRAASLKAIPFE